VKTSTKKKYILIGGVHKAGTTSLFTYLSWHPEICASLIKETHFFSDKSFIKRYNNYETYFRSKNRGHKFFLEASPEYLFGNEGTINRIKKAIHKPKIIFIFRNPSDKILSSFNHRKKRVLFSTDYTFENFISDHLNVIDLREINSKEPYSNEFFECEYFDYLPAWYENFDDNDIKILFFDDLKNSPKEVVEKILNWLGLEITNTKDEKFIAENKSVEFKSKNLQKIIIKLIHFAEPFLRRNYKIKNFFRNVYYSINVKKSNIKVNQSTIKKIDKLYEPKNKLLKDFLQQKGYTRFPSWLN